MNKKGFTLIELLATLVIIAIIMGIVLPSASRVSSENKDRMCVAYEEMMVEYAKTSLLKNRYYIELKDLDELTSVMKDCDGYVTVRYENDEAIYSPHVSCSNGCQSADYIELDDVKHTRVILEPAPTCISNLTYNGQLQNLVRSGDGYVLSNNQRKNIGTQNVTASLVDKNIFTWSDGSVDSKVIRDCTIGPKTVTLKANSVSFQRGNAVPSFGYTLTGTVTVNGIEENPLTSGVTYTVRNSSGQKVSITSSSPKGFYTITPSSTVSSNYTLSIESGTLEIEEMLPAECPTLSGYDAVYDGSNHSITVGTAVGGTIKYRTATSGTGSDWTTTAPTRKDYGKTTVYVMVAGDAEHLDNDCESATINIKKKTVTVTAGDKSMTYGGSAPSYSYTSSGAIGSETAVSGTATYTIKNGDSTISNVSSANAGSYSIVPSGLTVGDNYSVSYKNGTLTINKAGCAMSVSDPTTKYPGNEYDISTLVSGNKGTVTYALKSGGNNTTTNSTFSGSKLNIGAMSTSNDNNQSVDISITDAGNANYDGCTVNKSVTVAKHTRTLSWGGKTPSNNSTLTYGTSYTATASASGSGGTAGSISYSSSNTTGATINSSSGAITVANGNGHSVTITATLSRTATVKQVTTTRTYTTGKKAGTLTLDVKSGSSYGEGKACTTNYPAYTSSAIRSMKGCDSYVAITAKSGTVSCSIKDSTVGTCTVDNTNNVIKVRGSKYGQTKITITAAATDNTNSKPITLDFYGGIWEYSGYIYSDYSDCVSGTNDASDGRKQYGCGRTTGNVGPCNSAIYSYRCTTGTATQPPNTAQGGYCMCQYFTSKN